MQTAKAPASLHLGRQIKRQQRVRGISQEDLSFLADIHTSYLSKLERGVNSPTLPVMLKIAKALGMSGSELLRIVEESTLSEAK